ncbi:bifunctional riboflavin kinase/FAD synthetase [Salisediminibacterium beveridgei]|nr:bifunctional riboflavin kinase/FAD synthetase [Salisediminibacterium beveridgei]
MSYPQPALNIEPAALALGFFDGVHRGHQKVIRHAVEIAKTKGIKSGVMTFYPHPKEILRPDEADQVKYLSTLDEKINLIDALGVDYLFIVTFDESFADLSPQQFVDQFLIRQSVRHVIAGFDYTYGRMGKGTMETLPFHSRGMLERTVVNKVKSEDEKISSTSIRDSLIKGDIEKVNAYLGRVYSLTGHVEQGDQRGRTIGFPTANVSIDQKTLMPANGVYAVTVRTAGEEKIHKGICNIGFKPTFNDKHPETPVLEAHIFDYEGDLYDQELSVSFHKFIRGEQKFSGPDQLVRQINLDSEQVKAFFAGKQKD